MCTFVFSFSTMTIAANLLSIRQSLPACVKIVAVSKTQPVDALQEAYNAGQRAFGENRVQELVSKQRILPADTEWHFIGHLQRNKVRMLAPFISLIHSIDSLVLLEEVDREAHRCGRVIDCLLQFHIATEETKFGLTRAEAAGLLNSYAKSGMRNTRIIGVMGMASFSDDEDLVRSEFRNLHSIFEELKSNCFKDSESFSVVSMGMSGDYLIAVEEGSNLVRIGTSLFGSRSHPR